MWVKISITKKDLMNWEVMKGYFLWRIFSAKRAMRNPIKWWRRRQRVKQINQYLLNEAKRIEHGY